jgi:hypothetical protein
MSSRAKEKCVYASAAVAISYGSKAFDNEGSYKNVSDSIFTSLGNTLAPDPLSEPKR